LEKTMPYTPQRIRLWLILSGMTTSIAALLNPTLKTKSQTESANPESDRSTRGIETLRQIGGSNYTNVIRSLAAFLPDLARFTVEYVFGDILSRPGLDLQQREIAIVAALTAIGSVRSALKFHIQGMLNVGCSPTEVIETIMQAIVYAGFPATQDGIAIAREVFQEQGIQFQPTSNRPEGERYQLGIEHLRQIEGDRARDVITQFSDIAPDLGRLTVEFAYGEIGNRPGLSLKSRELATLAMVVAIGNQDNSVKNHVERSIRAGVTETEIRELLLQMTVYAGFPKTVAAVTVAREAFAELKQPRNSATSSQSNFDKQQQPETNEVRYSRGLDALNQISQESGEAVVNSFEDIAPDLGRYIVEFSYGDIFSRPNLDLKTRELATVSALTALNTTASELPLDVHINGALNVGANPQEIVEAMMQMIPYVGFLKVQQSIAIAKTVFNQRNV
jgi:4-carboxymuconolactone decarboxylase